MCAQCSSISQPVVQVTPEALEVVSSGTCWSPRPLLNGIETSNATKKEAGRDQAKPIPFPLP